MKKKLFYLLALSVSLGLVVSCDKTTEETPDLETIISANLAGTYGGELIISLSDGQETSPIPQQVIVEKEEGESITLSVKDFSYDILSLGDIVLENCAVAANGDGTYSFTGETTLILMDGDLEAEVSATGTFTLSDTVSLSLSLDIKASYYYSGVYFMSLDVTVTYAGTKLTGNEGTEAKIISFTIDSNEGVIDDDGGTISVTVSQGDVTSLTPTIVVSDGATVDPASGESQDFSDSVEYTVVSEDFGTTKTYTVTVTLRAGVEI